jgi:exonuclease SbcC
MYIKNVLIEGFGKFVDKTFTFSKNSNLIFGVNESGKTTLMNFLLAMLFGFKNDSGELTEEYYKFKPWNTNYYGGEMIFYLDNNSKEYTIKRNFLSGDVFLYEGQKDITNSINYEPNGAISFIKEKLGFSRNSFLTLFKHTDVNITKSGLNDYIIKLENFMEKENDTIKVKNALSSIEGLINSIGDISDPYSPLGKLSDEAKTIETQLSSLKKEYNDIWKVQENLNSINKELTLLIKKKKNISDQIQSYEAKEILTKLDNIRNLRKSYDETKAEILQIEKYKDVDSSELISLERFEATSEELKRNLENVQTKHSNVIKRLRDLEKNIEIYEQRFGIKDFSDVDKLYLKVKNINLSYGIIKERLKILNDLEADLDSLRKKSESLLKEFTSINDKFLMLGDLDEFNEQVDSYLKDKKDLDNSQTEEGYTINARMILTDKSTNNFTFAFFLSLSGVFAGFILGFFITPWLYLISAAGLVFTIVYLILIIKTRSSINLLYDKMKELKQDENERLKDLQVKEARIYKALQIAGIKDIQQYKDLYKKYISINNTDNSKIMTEKAKEVQRLKKDVDVAIEQLNKDLSDFNVLSEENIEKSIAILNEDIENYKTLSFEKGKLSEDVKKFTLEIDELKRKTAEISRNISDTLNNLGFEDISSYRMALDKKEKYFKLFTKLKQIEIDLEKSDAREQERYEKYIQENKHLLDIEPKSDLNHLNIQLNDIEEKIDEHRLKLKNAKESLKKMQNSILDIGFLKSNLSYINYEMSNMIDEKNNLIKLYETMKIFYDKVRRNFVPKLTSDVSYIFNSIVDNDAYSINLNDNLEIQVLYNGENITSNISKGTYHQLALSLKLALASIMSVSEESLCILLDDAFSEYDDGRMKPTIKFLKSISKSMQVIISTCRVDVKNVIKDLKFKIINLG